MKKFIIFFAMLSMATGCSYGKYLPTNIASICRNGLQYGTRFSNLAVALTVDMHGGYVSPSSCPEKTYSADFSKSDLDSIQNRALVEAISRNSVLPGKPIELIISGYLRKSNDLEVRDVMMIDKVNSFIIKR